MSVTFAGIKRTDSSNPPKWCVVNTPDGAEVMVSGQQSIAKIIESSGRGTFEGELFTIPGKDGQRWRLPSERSQGRSGGFRDPLAELVGISHSQAFQAFLAAYPENTDKPEKLSVFWKGARESIKQMALEIAQDRLEIKSKLGGAA